MNRSTLGLLSITLLLLSACGNGDTHSAPNAAASGASSPSDSNGATASVATVADSGELLPDADPATYVGRNRVVNLLVMPDGTQPVVDVWVMRSFQYAPILVAEGLGYGDVSDWFGRPENMSVATVLTGAGPDAATVAGLLPAAADEQLTHLVMWDGESQSAGGFVLGEKTTDPTQAFPPADPTTGLVQLYAYQLKIHPMTTGESWERTLGGHPVEYSVGIEGTPGCAPQPRITDAGFAPSILGGTQRVPLDLAPGTSNLTFHGWGSTNADCADPTLVGPFPITVTAGSRQWMLLHSPDGVSIEALTIPVD
jgi:hypothetical protein